MSLLLAAAAVAAQTASPPLTLREAQALSPRELAARVLGTVGSLYREARIWDGHSNFGDTGRATIEFAGTSRSTGNSEMCVADTMFVSFSLVGDRRAGPDRRMRPDGHEGPVTRHAYRIIGDTNDRRERSDAEERAQDARCARAGPVLGDWATKRFFAGQHLEGADAYLAARMLQAVIADARRGAVSHLTCADDSPDVAPVQACADPRAVLAGLSTDGLRYVRLDRCAENATHLCADLNFAPVAQPGDVTTILKVIVEIDTARADPPPDTFRVLGVTIRKESGIED